MVDAEMNKLIEKYLNDLKADIIFIKKLLIDVYKSNMKRGKKTGKYKCVNCGNTTLKIEGSIKHPYCKKCFKKVWNNDYQKYNEWLDFTHG